MIKLGLKTLNVVPCYCHHMLPTMWETLNTLSLSIFRTMCESGPLLAHSISNVLSCCRPSTTYWFLNLGNEIKVTGRISPWENGYLDARRPTSIVVSDADCSAVGTRFGDDMDVFKCIVPLRHRGTLNSRRAASPLVWLVEGEERRDASDHLHSL
ncbi:uncharacterized protein TNCV_1531721 [Trichonephila clavipes]|nr:uncharacterized protein TNCV_1531721 [Trichonephila clavipes]